MEIVAESHLDHGLNEAHIAFLKARFAEKTAFFIETLELPEGLPSLECGLHGPLTGGEPVPEAEVFYGARNGRAGHSRLCTRAPLKTRKLTVIAGPAEGKPCVLYTAYGGPLAPREPWDETLSAEEKAESEAFWKEHALTE